MKNIFKLSLLLLGLISIQSCSTDEEGSGISTPAGTVALQIDGAQRVSSQGVATATFNETNSGQTTIYSFAIAAGFADFSGNNWSITTLLSSDQIIELSDGQSWDQDSLNATTTFDVSYSENFNLTNDFFRAEYVSGQSFTLTITSVDFINETISGEFSIEIEDSEGETYQITNGRFNQISYNEP